MELGCGNPSPDLCYAPCSRRLALPILVQQVCRPMLSTVAVVNRDRGTVMGATASGRQHCCTCHLTTVVREHG